MADVTDDHLAVVQANPDRLFALARPRRLAINEILLRPAGQA